MTDAKQTPLQFRPLSEGLGFHPFSDGLPYAPISPVAKSSKSGAGATTAGRPTFITPTPIPTPRAMTPSAISIASPAAVPVRPQQHSQPVTQAQPLLHSETHHGAVYLVQRVLAYLLDSIFNLALCGGALSLALWKQDLSPELLINPGIVLIAGLFLATFNWAITTAQEVAFGTSVGKRVFGLALLGPSTAIFLRAFFFVPSLAFGGIGLIWALFDKRRRCWHDLVVDLQPIEAS